MEAEVPAAVLDDHQDPPLLINVALRRAGLFVADP